MTPQLLMGYRFYPTDEELLWYLLKKYETASNYNCPVVCDVNHNNMDPVRDVNLNNMDPWKLPAEASIENKWYCYWVPDKKYNKGRRIDRFTKSGVWKATGMEQKIYNSKTNLIGMKKTFIFHRGRAVKGLDKTNWFMHEFRLPDTTSNSEGWVLSRVFEKDTGTKFSSSFLSPSSRSSCNTNHVNNPETGGNHPTFTPPLSETLNKLSDISSLLFEGSNHEIDACSHPTSYDHSSVLPEALPPNYHYYSNNIHVKNPEIGGHQTLGGFDSPLFINEDYSLIIDDLSAPLPPTTLNGDEREDEGGLWDMNWDTIF